MYDDIVVNSIISWYDYAFYQEEISTTKTKHRVKERCEDDMVGLLQDTFGIGVHTIDSKFFGEANKDEEHVQYAQYESESDILHRLMVDVIN